MSGSMSLEMDGTPASSPNLDLFMRMMSSVCPRQAQDQGSAVSNRYEAQFPLQGKLHEVEIQILTRQDAESRDAEAAAEMSRQ